jgi:hypothetical protein
MRSVLDSMHPIHRYGESDHEMLDSGLGCQIRFDELDEIGYPVQYAKYNGG